jgi:hypothetical protein
VDLVPLLAEKIRHSHSVLAIGYIGFWVQET